MPDLHQLLPKALPVAVVGAIALVIFGLQGNSAPGEQLAANGGTLLTAEAFASVVTVESQARRLTIVAPIPGSVIIRPGETTAFTAVAFDQTGREILGLTFDWRIADQSAGSITPTGIFQAGQSDGEFVEAVIAEVASSSSFGSAAVQGTVDITVQRNFSSRVPASIRLLPSVVEAAPGQTVFLTALGLDSTGALLPGGQPTWQLTDSQAGSVTPNGGFTAGDTPGLFPQAITVTLSTRPGEPPIVDSLDVLITEATTQGEAFNVVILPQTVVLRPGEEFEFDAIIIDLRDGSRLDGIPVEWLSSDPLAGIVSAQGRFVASFQVGTYPDAVEAVFDLSGSSNLVDEFVTARATVIVVENTFSTLQSLPTDQLSLVPPRVILSPGKLATMKVAGLPIGTEIVAIKWEVDPRGGELTLPGQIKAGEVPGVYSGAIKASVTVEFEGAVATRELYSDLVIPGPLATVQVQPRRITTSPGNRLQLIGIAKDAGGVQLFDVNFRWSMEDDSAGSIDPVGSFVATGNLGEFPDAIKVTAIQLAR